MVKQNNKRIAKNTLIIYIRIFVTMFVGLFTSRFVLQALGVSDYGLYNVVGGVIAMFTFISGSLASTTTRFVNYEMGKADGNTNRIFNVSNVLHCCFALLIFLLAESIGVFYIENYLNVDPGKETDAMFVFQVSTIVACIGIVNVPFQSLFIAHEKFSLIAMIDIFNTIIRLLLVLLLFLYKGNVLRLYAISMSTMTFVTFVAYHYYCYKYWPETVRLKFVKDFKAYKELLAFNNYNLLGTASLVARHQGSNMLINFFFGTTVNAAYAIANNVQTYVNIFIGNFDTAAGPQIVQNVSAGKIQESLQLVYRTCRICILLMIIVFFPLFVELDFILKVWLGNVPDGASTFCKYTLMIAVISSTSGGLSQFINGYGKIKWFKIQFSVLYILCIPLGVVLFKMGLPAYYITILFIVSDSISRLNQLLLLKRMIGLKIMSFVKESYFKPALVFGLLFAYSLCYEKMDIQYSYHQVFGIIVTAILSVVTSFVIGLKKNEKESIKSMIINKFKRHEKNKRIIS